MTCELPPPRPAALAEDDLTSGAQRLRRARILETAVAIARLGGYDGVHMGMIAEQADVAKGTLYRYFPSKTHLLVAALLRELGAFERCLAEPVADSTDPYLRLQIAIRHLTAGMERWPRLADALIRAFVHASVTLTDDTDLVRQQQSSIFANSLSGGRPDVWHRQIGDIFADIWAAGMLGLGHGTRSISEVRDGLCRTAALLAHIDPAQRR